MTRSRLRVISAEPTKLKSRSKDPRVIDTISKSGLDAAKLREESQALEKRLEADSALRVDATWSIVKKEDGG